MAETGAQPDLRQHARIAPDRPAVIMAESGRTITFGELDQQSRAIADLWWELGAREGDHVAVLVQNQPEFFSVYWAAMRSGLYLTAVNPFLTLDEAAYIIDNCEAQILMVAGTLTDISSQLVDRQITTLEHVFLIGDAEDLPAGHLRLDDALRVVRGGQRSQREPLGRVMLYSSGTTGRPKGIKKPLTGAEFGTGSEMAQILPGLLGVGPDTVYLSSAPLYHLAASVYVDAVNANGGTVIVMERFDAAQALVQIERFRVTLAQFVPTMLIRMLKLPEDVRAAADLSSLRAVVHGAGPCPASAKVKVIDWLGPIVHEYYGGTEDNGNTFITSQEWLEHRGSVGRPLSTTKVHICDLFGDEVSTGGTGVIYLETSAQKSAFEYHGDPMASAGARHPRHPTWTTLGDVGHLDEDGYLYLTDRLNFMIVSGGVNIYPREIEDALAMHPAVIDVAVIGVPDDEMGEVVKAVVQPRDPALAGDGLAAELIEYVRERLAHYKCPRSVDFVDELPRLPTGKLYKRVLVDRYRADR